MVFPEHNYFLLTGRSNNKPPSMSACFTVTASSTHRTAQRCSQYNQVNPIPADLGQAHRNKQEKVSLTSVGTLTYP